MRTKLPDSEFFIRMLRSVLETIYDLRPEVVKLARPHHWAEARQWLWYILLGGCLPFWGGTLLLLLFAQSQSWTQLTGRGELALFSAGIFASAIPLMRKKVRRAAVEHVEGLFIVCIALLLAAAFILSAVTLAERFPVMPRPDLPTMIASSISLFVISIAIGFFVELTNNVRNDPDLVEFSREDQETLRLRFADKVAKDPHE